MGTAVAGQFSGFDNMQESQNTHSSKRSLSGAPSREVSARLYRAAAVQARQRLRANVVGSAAGIHLQQQA